MVVTISQSGETADTLAAIKLAKELKVMVLRCHLLKWSFGLLLCGSANGVAITANKHAGIRAGLAWNTEVASLVRQHNDANVLSIGARVVGIGLAEEIVTTFITTAFEGGRHARRVAMLTELENEF